MAQLENVKKMRYVTLGPDVIQLSLLAQLCKGWIQPSQEMKFEEIFVTCSYYEIICSQA